MKFVQYYLDCLSHASYLIGDETTGRAVVVDPRRDVDEYVRDAEEAGLRIELVLETHFHADFLSGHLELAEATGAEIAFGPGAEAQFNHRVLADGERIELGEVVLEIRHTPGHTPESISIVVYETPDATVPYGVLTGDTLFIGDVGRPDLLVSAGVSADELAGCLYDSLQDKLLTLPDATRVFPGHGAGSACGKNLSTETWSTLGDQRRTNYALLFDTREEFVSAVTEGQPAAPGYFAAAARRNREDRELLDASEAPHAMNLDAVREAQASGAVVVDTRDAVEFAYGHLVGSVNVGLEGRYAEYAGSVIDPQRPIVLVVEPGLEVEAKNRLARIGYDNVIGHLDNPLGTLLANPDLVGRSSRLTADQLAERSDELDGLQLVDVRNEGEHRLGAIPGAVNIPLSRLVERIDELDPERPTVVYCLGGYRSSLGASLLRELGFADVSDLLGGYEAWAVQPVSAP
ncbi:MAG: MBL fold metallo-hydrolase [Acidimicrobiales bacterium]|nr:MBL fold metallo-hydrolase [Acidimicrobiales bacterium]